MHLLSPGNHRATSRLAFFAVLASLMGALSGLAGPTAATLTSTTNAYPGTVTWLSPGKGAADSMPLGNGEVGINLWVEADGDLLFYIGRNDTFSEVSELCKAGCLRVNLSPNPFRTGQPFHQELRLAEGLCHISAGTGQQRVELSVFVDAENPVIHITGEAASPLAVTAKIESWRTERQKLPSDGATWTLQEAPFELWQSADVFVPDLSTAIAWYHRNEESTAFESTLKIQSLEPIRETLKDPLLHRTFGGWVEGSGFQPVDARTLKTPKSVRSFALRVASPCEQTPTAQAWLELAQKAARRSSSPAAARKRTTAWWDAFWKRSWVITDAGAADSIPTNSFPLRVGIDGAGHNQFPGAIGKVTLLGRVLSSNDIASLATTAPQTEHSIAPTMPELQDGLTIAAWIRPAALTPGRIIDKITPGGSDGFLFDTHPGDTLRFIVGRTTLTGPARLFDTGNWHHAAASYDKASGAMRIYLDGRLVAEVAGSGAGEDAPGRMSVGRAYTLQRYMQACAGRGPYPIKFNGSLFTVEPTAMGLNNNPDWRRWGDCHWWQNVRMPYNAMPAAGDFDLMKPLFHTFEAIRPFAEARTRLYHGVEGCYFAETMTVWGTYANRDYGWNRAGLQPNDVQCRYWRYAWNQGLELTGLILDYWDYTRDEVFLKQHLLPMAESVLKYFDTRFPKDAQGKIVLTPTQAVETYWYNVTNDAPAVAGLNSVTERLCALPRGTLTAAQSSFFAYMKSAAPTVPVEEVEHEGQKLRRLAVAQNYKPQRSNVENPELFPIWPFRLYGLGKPMLEEARNAYALRGSKNDVGWGYDGNAAALLGLTDEAARILRVKIANSNPRYRWPATWGPNFDWLPDQCHGGNLMLTTQLMLLQSDGDTLRLLPAWPKDWNVEFKLHANRDTTVECVYRDGKVLKLVVTPASRTKDVVFPMNVELKP